MPVWLDNCEVITGKVAFKDIIRIKRYKYKKNHFLFSLSNSNQSFITSFEAVKGIQTWIIKSVKEIL